MDEKVMINFEVEKDDKTFTFSMPYGASHGSAYDAAHAFMIKIVEMSNESAKKAERVVEGPQVTEVKDITAVEKASRKNFKKRR